MKRGVLPGSSGRAGTDLDVLREDDIEIARRTPPDEKLLQALEMMRAGFQLKLASLRAQHPDEAEAEIDERYRRWLALEDD